MQNFSLNFNFKSILLLISYIINILLSFQSLCYIYRQNKKINCFNIYYSIVTPQGGYINTMDLYKKHIYFCIVFGIRGCTNNENQFKIDETCKNGIICAAQILQTVKTIVEIQSIFIGMSTGNNALFCSKIY